MLLAGNTSTEMPGAGCQPGRLAKQIVVPVEFAAKGIKEQIGDLGKIVSCLKSPEHEASLLQLDHKQILVLMIELLEQQLIMSNQMMGLLASLNETSRQMNLHLRSIDLDVTSD